MRKAGRVVAEMHAATRAAARPGVTTAELDRVARDVLERRGARSNFLNYHGFPAVICASPNDMIVHGIPGEYALQHGDLLSVDVGVTLNGFVADSAITIAIEHASPEAQRLIDICEQSLRAGIEECRSGNRLGDISHAVQEVVEARGFGVVRALVGHGVGRSMHEDPQIPNYGQAGRGPKLASGMVFAIEPMITLGTWDVTAGDDGWAVYTADGSLASHCEHTVAVTESGPRVLTLRSAARQVATG